MVWVLIRLQLQREAFSSIRLSEVGIVYYRFFHSLEMVLFPSLDTFSCGEYGAIPLQSQEVNFFYIILVWTHLIAATFWVGGMLFLSLVAVPLLRQASDPPSAQRGFISLARRFRTLVWIALFILVVTGLVLLGNVINFGVPLFSWPPVVLTKLILVFLLVVVSFTHDRIMGPKVRTLKSKAASELSVGEGLLLRFSPLLGRLTLLLGLGVLLSAVIMVRS